MAELAIKLHSFTAGEGHEPNYGIESADFRGEPNVEGSKFIGKDQGDHHHVLWEKKGISEAQADQVLPVLTKFNSRLKDANIPEMLDELTDILGADAGGVVDDIINALGGFPNLRFGVWNSHA